jgi:hypothetical protein
MITVLYILVSFLNIVAYATTSTPSSVTLKIPYQIPQGNDWCNDRGANLVVHQDVPECGRVCSMVNPTDGAIYRGLFKDKSWSTNVPCSACRQAQWPGCPSFSSKIKKQSSDVLSILAPSPSNAIKVSDNSGINHPKIAETKVQLTNDNQKHKIQSPADKDDVMSDASTILKLLKKSNSKYLRSNKEQKPKRLHTYSKSSIGKILDGKFPVKKVLTQEPLIQLEGGRERQPDMSNYNYGNPYDVAAYKYHPLSYNLNYRSTSSSRL